MRRQAQSKRNRIRVVQMLCQCSNLLNYSASTLGALLHGHLDLYLGPMSLLNWIALMLQKFNDRLHSKV